MEPSAVSVKGTTSDGLGFAGAEGVAAFAVATVSARRMTDWIGGRRPVAEALAAGRRAHRLIVSRTARPSPELKAILAVGEAGIGADRADGGRPAGAAGRLRWTPGRAAGGRATALGRRGGDPRARNSRRARPAAAGARASPGSGELRCAAALRRGCRRRRGHLPGARSGSTFGRGGQGQRGSQRAPAAGPGDQPRGDPQRADGTRRSAGRRRPGCGGIGLGVEPAWAGGGDRRQRGERAVRRHAPSLRSARQLPHGGTRRQSRTRRRQERCCSSSSSVSGPSAPEPR